MNAEDWLEIRHELETLRASQVDTARLREAAQRVLAAAVADTLLLGQFGHSQLLTALEELKAALEKRP